MQIWTPSANPRDEGDFYVALAGTSRSFVTIELSEDHHTALVMQNVGDCDRLIRAAEKAKRLLADAASQLASDQSDHDPGEDL